MVVSCGDQEMQLDNLSYKSLRISPSMTWEILAWPSTLHVQGCRWGAHVSCTCASHAQQTTWTNTPWRHWVIKRYHAMGTITCTPLRNALHNQWFTGLCRSRTPLQQGLTPSVSHCMWSPRHFQPIRKPPRHSASSQAGPKTPEAVHQTPESRLVVGLFCLHQEVRWLSDRRRWADTYASLHLHTYIGIHMCVYIYMYVYIYIYVCACVYIYIYIYYFSDTYASMHFCLTACLCFCMCWCLVHIDRYTSLCKRITSTHIHMSSI